MAELRDAEGRVVIPSLVPPETERPVPHPGNMGTKSASISSPVEDPDLKDAIGSSALDKSASAHAKMQPTETAAVETMDSSKASNPLRPNVTKSGTDGVVPTLGHKRIQFDRSRTSGFGSSPNTKPFQYSAAFQNDDSSESSSDEELEAKQNGKRQSVSANQAGKILDEKAARAARRKEDGPYSRFKAGNEQFKTRGKIDRRDGRVNLSINETKNSGYLAKTLGSTVRRHFTPGNKDSADHPGNAKLKHADASEQLMEDPALRPRLTIVILVIGSRGDIQPFVKIGKILKEEYGHRVRLATHPTFREFVEKDSGLEFFSVGGDPSELMAFMVKNPGLIPSLETVRAGEIGRRRDSMYEMFEGMWRACINATDDEHDKTNLKMMGRKSPFVADAIIANPPSFAHVHIAEALGIPLHMMFTFPYTPTTMFPHPLANIQKSNLEPAYTNFMTYPLVELMTWQGLGDLINKFRTRTLGLEAVSTIWAPGQLYRFNVPYTYMWSPSLIAKPPDWGPEIEITGFVFLELASSFKPPQELVDFLEAGDPPVYIGFGSIVVDDPEAFTKMIFEAVEKAGVRALVSKGWGGIGGDSMDVPKNVFLLENTPHDWLFPKVSAVVHHGGAGTTAIGLKCAKPTMIVPFFGDQPFWGSMVAENRAGAFECTPYKKLTADKLAEGIKQCLTDEARENVKKIADGIEEEGNGALNAVRSFHRSLPLRGSKNMRCSILDNRIAVWQLRKSQLRLSALAAEILVEQKKIKWADLKLIRHYEWNDFDGPGEPISGVGTAVWNAVRETGVGIGRLPMRATKVIKRRNHHEEKKKKWDERRARKTSHDGRLEGNLDNAAAETPADLIVGNGSDAGADDDNDDDQSDSKGEDEETHKDAKKSLTDPKNSTARPQAQHKDTQVSKLSALSEEPESNLVEALAIEAGQGVAHSGIALAKLPLDLSLAIAQGFHNAPRLYGDSTVRVPRRISGFHSGLRASRDEFMYGIYDGVTGVVRLPIKGMREDGMWGGAKGVAMGLGGLVLKDIAALVGPPAYAVKGIEKEMMKRKTPTRYVRRARITQGAKEIWDIRTQEENKKAQKADLGSLSTTPSQPTSAEGRRARMRRMVTGKPAASPQDETSTENATGNKQKSDQKPATTATNSETLGELISRVDHGWEVFQTGMHFVANRRNEGPFGKMRIHFERNKMQEEGGFENIDAIKQYMQSEHGIESGQAKHGHGHGSKTKEANKVAVNGLGQQTMQTEMSGARVKSNGVAT